MDMNVNRGSTIIQGGEVPNQGGVHKNQERDGLLRLERALEGSLMPLNEFAIVGGEVRDAPVGNGEGAVDGRRSKVKDFFSKLGHGIRDGIKSLVGKVKGFFAERAETKEKTAELTKLMGNAPNGLDTKKLGTALFLADGINGTAQTERVLEQAIKRAENDFKANPEKVGQDGFVINLSGSKQGGASVQLSDDQLGRVKDVARAMLNKGGLSEAGTSYLNQLLQIPSMTHLENEAFVKHVAEDKSSGFLRGNTIFTTRLAINAQENISTNTVDIMKGIFESEGGKALLERIESLETEQAQIQKEYGNQVTERGNELAILLKTTPEDRGMADLIAPLVNQLIDQLLGDTPNSVRNTTSDSFKLQLQELGGQIRDAEGVEGKQGRIDGLYQNATVLRGTMPMITDLVLHKDFGDVERKALTMITQVFQMLANDTIMGERKPQALKDVAAPLIQNFSQKMTQTMDALGRPVLG